MTKRYNYHEHFEMLMVRHDYLSKLKNVDPSWIDKWKHIVKKTSKIVFDKNPNAFLKVGYSLEDVIAVTNCYMISYMELYSIERIKKEKDKFVSEIFNKKGRYPTEEEFSKRERAKLISFLRQRLYHAITVCNRKSRNIIANVDKKGFFAKTPDSKEATNEMIYNNHKELGYRAISNKELKEIKKKNKNSKILFDKDGFPIIKVEIFAESPYSTDHTSYNGEKSVNIIDKIGDCSINNPENILMDAEDRDEIEGFVQKFNEMNNKDKRKRLNKFISENKGSKNLRKELSLARKMLKEIKVNV